MLKIIATHYVEICCVAGTILSYYGSGMITFYYVLVWFGILLYKFKNGKVTFALSNPFLLFIGCFFLLRVLHFSISDIPLGTLMMIIFLAFFQGQINKERLIRIYRGFAKINIYYLFVQVLTKLITNIALPGIFYFLPIIGDTEDVDVGQLAETMASRDRFSGFFMEPSHLAAFLLPLTAIDLFYRKNYRNVWIYVLALLLSKSGVGFVGLLVIAVFAFVKRMRKLSAKQVLPSVLLLLTLSLTSLAVVKAGYADDILERQEELSMDNEYSSGFVRVIRGYLIYDMMSPKDKIIGAPNATVKFLIERSSVADSFARQGENMIYLNFIQRLLIYGGLITAIFFFIYYLLFMRKVDYTGKCCISILFAISFMSGMNFSAQMLLMFISAFVFIKDANIIKTIRI